MSKALPFWNPHWCCTTHTHPYTFSQFPSNLRVHPARILPFLLLVQLLLILFNRMSIYTTLHIFQFPSQEYSPLDKKKLFLKIWYARHVIYFFLSRILLSIYILLQARWHCLPDCAPWHLFVNVLKNMLIYLVDFLKGAYTRMSRLQVIVTFCASASARTFCSFTQQRTQNHPNLRIFWKRF